MPFYPILLVCNECAAETQAIIQFSPGNTVLADATCDECGAEMQQEITLDEIKEICRQKQLSERSQNVFEPSSRTLIN